MFVQVLQWKPYPCQNGQSWCWILCLCFRVFERKKRSPDYFLYWWNKLLFYLKHESSWSGMGGFFSFYHSFSYPYGKLLKSDKVKSNTECLIQSSRDSSQEIDGAMIPTYITSTLLPVQTWRPCNTILLQTHFLKIYILFKKISFGLWLAQSLFSVHLNFLYFFLQVLFFLSSFLLQSLIFISPTQEPFRHPFI